MVFLGELGALVASLPFVFVSVFVASKFSDLQLNHSCKHGKVQALKVLKPNSRHIWSPLHDQDSPLNTFC